MNNIIIFIIFAISFTVIYYLMLRKIFRNKYNYSFQSLEVNGVPVCGYEEDYLLLDRQVTISMSELLTQQGLKKISWSELCAFQRYENDPDDHFLPCRQQYVLRTGNILPPVYKIKFEITAEPLSDEEIKEFWDKQIC